MSVIRHRVIAATVLTLALSGAVVANGTAQPVSYEAMRKGHHSKAAHLVWVPGFGDITGSTASQVSLGA